MFAEGGANLQCLALCEVIDYEKRYKPNPYYVVPECGRFALCNLRF